MDSTSENSDTSSDEEDSWEPKMKRKKPSTLPRLWCKYCYEGFRYMARLTQHMAVHTDKQPFECSKCAARFKYVSSLNSHQRKHDKVKEFKCLKCDKSFLQQSELTKHSIEHLERSGEETRSIEKVEDVAVFSCKKCAVTFDSSIDLVLHKRTMEHTQK